MATKAFWQARFASMRLNKKKKKFKKKKVGSTTGSWPKCQVQPDTGNQLEGVDERDEFTNIKEKLMKFV